MLLKSQKSKAYGEFCKKVYGRNLCQFNMFDEEQLQKLLTELNLNNTHIVLDLGCGNGLISEYISDLTGAKVIGIDYAGGAIKEAQKLTWTPTLVPIAKRVPLRKTRQRESQNEGETVHGRTDHQNIKAS
jgi:2-polyprenyl-3-methyl-5-hydroxy-6-metoxy-1,4-benzoquinol methylase